jgi:hypothetical protein
MGVAGAPNQIRLIHIFCLNLNPRIGEEESLDFAMWPGGSVLWLFHGNGEAMCE